jgi:hypothetical protein
MRRWFRMRVIIPYSCLALQLRTAREFREGIHSES